MHPEKGSKNFNIDDVIRLAKEITLRDGSHIPTLIVEGSDNSVFAPFETLPETQEERSHMMFAAGVAIGQSGQIGKLERLYFISEGWMSVVEKENPTILPPSQDPNRIETLIIMVANTSLVTRNELIIFEMVRDKEENLIDLRPFDSPMEEKERNAESPLLSAFTEGFRASDANDNINSFPSGHDRFN